VSNKEATERVKINKLLEAAGWRFFPDHNGPDKTRLKPSVALLSPDLDSLGENFEKAQRGFVDFLVVDNRDFPRPYQLKAVHQLQGAVREGKDRFLFL